MCTRQDYEGTLIVRKFTQSVYFVIIVTIEKSVKVVVFLYWFASVLY